MVLESKDEMVNTEIHRRKNNCCLCIVISAFVFSFEIVDFYLKYITTKATDTY
jgi:hypothetical protein